MYEISKKKQSDRKKQQEPCCRKETGRSRVNFDMYRPKASGELHTDTSMKFALPSAG